MGDMLKTASDWLARQQREHVSQSVHYCRASSVVCVPATRGRSDFTVSGDGFEVAVATEDFIVSAADLELDGELIVPAVGDYIVVGDLDDGERFDVVRENGIKPYRWADAYRTRYRVHTKHAGAHPATA